MANPNTLYVLESANLYCGDEDPSASKHLSLQELKLPALQEKYADHHAGGARVEIEIEVGVQKLEPTFKLVGVQPDVLVQFGMGAKTRRKYTMLGAVKDKRTGEMHQIKAIAEGRLGKVDPEAHQRGNLVGNDYGINEVVHYEVYFDGKELIYWDFFENSWRVDGEEQNADTNRALQIG